LLFSPPDEEEPCIELIEGEDGTIKGYRELEPVS